MAKSRLLNRGNKALESELINELADTTFEESTSKRVITDEMENMLLNYENYMANNEKLEVVFSTVTDDGVYSFVDEGIIFRSTLADLLPYSNMIPDLNKRADYINKELTVTIKEVDSENGIVYLTAEKQDTRQSVSAEERMIIRRRQATREIIQHMNEAEEKGTPFKLPVTARVFKVGKDYVLLNVMDYNILARVPISSWTKGFVRDLQHICKKGEVYQINLIGKRVIRSTKIIEWRAEHASFTSDPWSRINEDIVKVGTMLSLECVQVNNETNEWWGIPTDTSVIPQRMEIRCFVSEGSPIKPEVGKKYQCRISKVKIDKEHTGEIKNAILAKLFRLDTSTATPGIKKVEKK